MNYDQLRLDLIDYFGTAMSSGFPMAVIELSDVERASDTELIRIAGRVGFNLRTYEYEEE